MAKTFEELRELNLSIGESVEVGPNDDNSGDSAARFSMNAYTGQEVDTSMGRVVFKMSGMRIGKQVKPVLLDHDPTQIVGHTTEITKDGQLKAKGLISGASEEARQVRDSGLGGFPWQSSMGIRLHKVKQVPRGEEEVVNGTATQGPISVVTSSSLKELSFTPFGADDKTSARVVALFEGGKTLDLSASVDQDIEQPRDVASTTGAKTMSEETTATTDIATAASLSVDVEARLSEAKAADDARMDALLKSFPGRTDFVLAQYRAGHNVQEAKAELVDILIQEQAGKDDEITKLKDAAKLASEQKVAEVVMAGDMNNTVTTDTAEAEAVGDDIVTLSKREWNSDKDRIRTSGRFRSAAGYAAIRKAEEAGTFTVKGPTVVKYDDK